MKQTVVSYSLPLSIEFLTQKDSLVLRTIIDASSDVSYISKEAALKLNLAPTYRFASVERRLSKCVTLKEDYTYCSNEYLELGHMYEVDSEKYPNSYYIPHHCVLKESSLTTKLSVVFGASAQDVDMRSLNNHLLSGPKLQLDLLDLLIRFRFFKIAFTADIAKIYRQILINPTIINFN